MPSAIKSKSSGGSSSAMVPSSTRKAIAEMRQTDAQIAYLYMARPTDPSDLLLYRCEEQCDFACERIEPSSPREREVVAAIGQDLASKWVCRGLEPVKNRLQPTSVARKHGDMTATYGPYDDAVAARLNQPKSYKGTIFSGLQRAGGAGTPRDPQDIA